MKSNNFYINGNYLNRNDILCTVNQMRLPLLRSRAQAKPLFWTATTISFLVPLTYVVSIIGASPKSASGVGPEGGQLGVEGLVQAKNHTS